MGTGAAEPCAGLAAEGSPTGRAFCVALQVQNPAVRASDFDHFFDDHRPFVTAGALCRHRGLIWRDYARACERNLVRHRFCLDADRKPLLPSYQQDCRTPRLLHSDRWYGPEVALHQETPFLFQSFGLPPSKKIIRKFVRTRNTAFPLLLPSHPLMIVSLGLRDMSCPMAGGRSVTGVSSLRSP